MSKIITIYSATGRQGRSVVEHILDDRELSKEWKIRAVTRNPDKPIPKAFLERGVDVVKGDLDDEASIRSALKGAHTVFLNTNFWETCSKEVEVKQGKAVADAAKEVGISHLIYSSLDAVSKITDGKFKNMPHCDGKAEVEDYIRELEIPTTFVYAGTYMNNVSQSVQKGEDGGLTLGLPVGIDKAKLPCFDPADTGKYIGALLRGPNRPSYKQVRMIENFYTPSQLAAIIEEVTGKKTTALQAPDDVWKSFLPKTVAEEILETFKFFEHPAVYIPEQMEEGHKLLSGKQLTTFEAYVRSHAEEF